MRFRKADRQALTDLDRIIVTTPAGRHVPLRSLTLASSGTGPVAIKRRGQERSVTIKAGLTGKRDFGSVAIDVEQLLASIDMPDGNITQSERNQANRDRHHAVPEH